MQMLPEDEEAVLLPSAQEIATLSVEQLVYTLRAAAGSAAGADVAAACCLQLYKLVQRSGNDDAAAHAGAFAAIVAAMSAHHAAVAVQCAACEAELYVEMASAAQAAEWPRPDRGLTEARGSLRRALSLRGASGAPAGRGLSHRGSHIGPPGDADRCARRRR